MSELFRASFIQCVHFDTGIYAGQWLYIPAGPPYYPYPPCGSYYTVRYGDTLLGIGRIYGVSAWSIAAANGIYNMNRIYVGQQLLIPCH